MDPVHGILWGIFGLVVAGFLVVDLGFMSRKAHRVGTREAALQTLFWVAISLAYAGAVGWTLGAGKASEFLAAYVTEKMLSVDNLFVILMVFGYFGIGEKYRHRILYWGIMGAVVLRGLFIGLGSVAVANMHWLLYLFGAFLVYGGIKLLRGGDDDAPDLEKNAVVKWCRRHLPLAVAEWPGKFVAVENGRKVFTMAFVALLVVETTDVMFAFDSIPAVFAITTDPLIAFTSNIFAVMGLRALFFLADDVLTRFKYLKHGVSAVLVFIGAKMFLPLAGLHVGPVWSLCAIAGILAVSAALSVAAARKTA